MPDLRVTTIRGTDMVLDEATVQGFQTSLRGPLLRPGDAATMRPARSGMPMSTSGPRSSLAALASPT